MLAVESDRLHAVWAYCEGATLSAFYFEGTDGTRMDTEWADGTCYETPGATQGHVQLPALDMRAPRLIDNFEIAGPEIQLDRDRPGRIVLDEEQILYPFEHVDCTRNCGPNGWREVHSLLWSPDSSEVSFAILYLFEDVDEISINYALRLPSLDDPIAGKRFTASWRYRR